MAFTVCGWPYKEIVRSATPFTQSKCLCYTAIPIFDVWHIECHYVPRLSVIFHRHQSISKNKNTPQRNQAIKYTMKEERHNGTMTIAWISLSLSGSFSAIQFVKPPMCICRCCFDTSCKLCKWLNKSPYLVNHECARASV